MADATKGSLYDKFWFLIRDHRWKKNQQKDPHAVIELEVPPEQQDKVILAIRKRKSIEQCKFGRNYGKLLAIKHGDVIRFKLDIPEEQKI